MTNYENPKQQIIIGSTDITSDSIQTVITRRESGIDDLMLIVLDTEAISYLGTCHLGDEIIVKYSYDEIPDWNIVKPIFVGKITELNPNLMKTGEIVTVTALGQGAELKRMRIATEYGSQSRNSSVHNMAQFISSMLGDYVNKLMNDTILDKNSVIIPSSYNLGALGYDLTGEIPFVSYSWQDCFSALQDIMKIGASINYIANPLDWSGYHWSVDPETNRVMVAKVGKHAVGFVDVWSTRPFDEPIVVKEDMIITSFVHQPLESNMVVISGQFNYYFGKDVFEYYTEGHYADWYYHNSTGSDDPIARIGSNSLKIVGSYNEGDPWWAWFPGDGPTLLNLNLDCIGTGAQGNGDIIPMLSFYVARTGDASDVFVTLQKVENLGGYWVTTDYLTMNITDLIVTPDVNDPDYPFCFVQVPLGPNYKLSGSNKEWINEGTNPLDWNSINKIGFRGKNGGSGSINLWIDGIQIRSKAIRIALDSTNIKTNGSQILTIKDSELETYSTDSLEDSDPLSMQAVSELIRNKEELITGSIMIVLNPLIKPGQIVHIHASKHSDNTFGIDMDFRIVELKHTYVINGAMTQLNLASDTKNSIIRTNNSSSDYLLILKAVNPDFQNSTNKNVKISGMDFHYDLIPIVHDYA